MNSSPYVFLEADVKLIGYCYFLASPYYHCTSSKLHVCLSSHSCQFLRDNN